MPWKPTGLGLEDKLELASGPLFLFFRTQGCSRANRDTKANFIKFDYTHAAQAEVGRGVAYRYVSRVLYLSNSTRYLAARF